jgi:PAS domain S-box-containing protein
MADAVPQIVWITDAEGRTEFFNQQWFDYTGAERKLDTAGEVAAGHLHPDDAAPTMAAFEAARRGGHTFLIEHRIRARTGEYRWFLVRGEPQFDPQGGWSAGSAPRSTSMTGGKQRSRSVRNGTARSATCRWPR